MVGSTSSQKVQGMRQQREDRGKRGPRSGGAAGKIEDEGAACSSTDSAAEGSERSLQKPHRSHTLGEAVDETVADETGGLGSNVAGGEAGTAGGDNQVMGSSVGAQSGDDLVQLVREDERIQGENTPLAQKLNDRGAGEIGLLSLEAAVADGKDDGTNIR